MFPRFRDQVGPALDLIVEFSTLGEYRLAADGPVASSALAGASGQAPLVGWAGHSLPLVAASSPRRLPTAPTGPNPRRAALPRALVLAARACRSPRLAVRQPALGELGL